MASSLSKKCACVSLYVHVCFKQCFKCTTKNAVSVSLYYTNNILHASQTSKEWFSDSSLTLLTSLYHSEMFPKSISVIKWINFYPSKGRVKETKFSILAITRRSHVIDVPSALRQGSSSPLL